MLALTGERWSTEDLAALRAVGHSEGMPVETGLEMLDRWDRLWQSATDLTAGDRRELSRTSAFRRWKHLRANARRQPLSAFRGVLKMAVTQPQDLMPAMRGSAL
jgi:hypothetical protein